MMYFLSKSLKREGARSEKFDNQGEVGTKGTPENNQGAQNLGDTMELTNIETLYRTSFGYVLLLLMQVCAWSERS